VFELFKSTIYSIAHVIALTIFRTSYSGVLKTNMDDSATLATAEGKLAV
jgi:N-methylhydantoinase B